VWAGVVPRVSYAEVVPPHALCQTAEVRPFEPGELLIREQVRLVGIVLRQDQFKTVWRDVNRSETVVVMRTAGVHAVGQHWKIQSAKDLHVVRSELHAKELLCQLANPIGERVACVGHQIWPIGTCVVPADRTDARGGLAPFIVVSIAAPTIVAKFTLPFRFMSLRGWKFCHRRLPYARCSGRWVARCVGVFERGRVSPAPARVRELTARAQRRRRTWLVFVTGQLAACRRNTERAARSPTRIPGPSNWWQSLTAGPVSGPG